MSNQHNKSGSSQNRGGGRRRNPKGNQSNRRGGPPKPKGPPKPTAGQRFLQIITFGMAGKPADNQNTGRPKQSPRRGNVNPVDDLDSNQSGGGSSRSGGGGGGRSNSSGGNRSRGGGGGRSGGGGGRKKGGRPMEIVEVTTPRLYVGNLSFDADEKDLEELFGGVGSVQLAEIVANRRTQRSKGYGFVEMVSVDEAKRAVETLHDKDFMGRPLVVSGAKSTGPKVGEA